MSLSNRPSFALALSCLVLFYGSAIAIAVEPSSVKQKDQPTAKQKYQTTTFETVELFQAMQDGKIEVQFIPKDSSQATVIINNKGDEPLNIKLPSSFAGVPVLSQMGMGGMGGMGMGGMGGMGGGMGGMGGGMGGMGGGMGGMGGGGQGMGGGMGGMMGGMGGGMGGMGGGMGGMGGGMGGMGGGMGGMFRVAPDRPGKFKVPCVCLEHGKPEPTPRMKYTIVPIENLNKDPRVAKLCSLLGEGKVGQNTAQAAAWSIANGLSWGELAHKNRVESRYTGNIPWFNPIELQTALKLTSLIDADYQRNMSLNRSLEASQSQPSSDSEGQPIGLSESSSVEK